MWSLPGRQTTPTRRVRGVPPASGDPDLTAADPPWWTSGCWSRSSWPPRPSQHPGLLVPEGRGPGRGGSPPGQLRRDPAGWVLLARSGAEVGHDPRRPWRMWSLPGRQTTPTRMVRGVPPWRQPGGSCWGGDQSGHEQSAADVGVASSRDPRGFVERGPGLLLAGIEAGVGDPLPLGHVGGQELAEQRDGAGRGDPLDRDQLDPDRRRPPRCPLGSADWEDLAPLSPGKHDGRPVEGATEHAERLARAVTELEASPDGHPWRVIVSPHRWH